MSLDLYRLFLILDIPDSICPAECDRQHEYHLSEPAGLQTTEHGFDFPTPPIHAQRVLEYEVGDDDHYKMMRAIA